jgi:diketogulonate reductase-like aldo/keto reductase
MENNKRTTTIELRNGVIMPSDLGLGTYLLPAEATEAACRTAFECGYRLFDTAIYYENEEGVGQALQNISQNARTDAFVTTKVLLPPRNELDVDGRLMEQAMKDMHRSFKKIDGQGACIDLFLIHSPRCGKERVKKAWRLLESWYEEPGRGRTDSHGNGPRVRALGVSNFGIAQIESMRQCK